jgi:hypothetical protein
MISMPTLNNIDNKRQSNNRISYLIGSNNNNTCKEGSKLDNFLEKLN